MRMLLYLLISNTVSMQIQWKLIHLKLTNKYIAANTKLLFIYFGWNDHDLMIIQWTLNDQATNDHDNCQKL